MTLKWFVSFSIHFGFGLVAFSMSWDPRVVEARPRYEKVWKEVYLNKTTEHQCGLCHVASKKKSLAYNDYGIAIREALGTKDIKDENAIREALSKAKDKMPNLP